MKREKRNINIHVMLKKPMTDCSKTSRQRQGKIFLIKGQI